MSIAVIGTTLSLLGLLLTGYGAFVASRAVIISDEQAKILSDAYFGDNNALRDALKAQSRSARNGILRVVFGTALQVIGLKFPLLVAMLAGY
jgi:hypothetical protein